MKKNHIKIHLVSLGILALGFAIAKLFQPIPPGFESACKILLVFALAVWVCSVFMGGKIIPFIISSGFLVTFLAAFLFQKDGFDPGGGSINNFWYLWIGLYFGCFVLSLILEAVYKKIS